MAKRKRESKTALVKQAAPTPPMDYEALVTAIEQAHQTAQRQAVRAVNIALALRNWLIGYYIAEYEPGGRDRAQYG